MPLLDGLKVVRSSIHGYGLVTLRPFAKGETVCLGDGVLYHEDDQFDDTYSLVYADDDDELGASRSFLMVLPQDSKLVAAIESLSADVRERILFELLSGRLPFTVFSLPFCTIRFRCFSTAKTLLIVDTLSPVMAQISLLKTSSLLIIEFKILNMFFSFSEGFSLLILIIYTTLFVL